MITEQIITALLELGSWFLSLLPEDSMSWPSGTAWKAIIADNLGGLDAIFPLNETAAVAEDLLTVVLPVVLTYRVSLFIWFALPVVK